MNSTVDQAKYFPLITCLTVSTFNIRVCKKTFSISRKIKSNYRNVIKQKVFINPSDVSKLLAKSLKPDVTHIDFLRFINNLIKFDPHIALRVVEFGLCTGFYQSADYKLKQYI